MCNKLIFLIISAFLLTACSGKPVKDGLTGGDYQKTVGAGYCKENSNITPQELDEKTHALTDLNRLLSSGSLKTISALITYEGPTDRPGYSNTTLSLSAVSDRGTENVLLFSKVCAKNFTPTLAAENPIEIRIPIRTDEDGRLVYNVYTIDYGPKYLTPEFFNKYLHLESISSASDDFVDSFGDDAPTSFEDIINDETSKAYIEKVNEEIPDSFDDENAANTYTIAYADEEAGIRYHLTVLWTPDDESDNNEDGDSGAKEEITAISPTNAQ